MSALASLPAAALAGFESCVCRPCVPDDEVVRKTILREVKILRMLKQVLPIVLCRCTLCFLFSMRCGILLVPRTSFQDNIVNLKEAFRRKGKLYLVRFCWQ